MTVNIPTMPVSFGGEFAIFIKDVQVGTLTVLGIEERPFLVGDGTPATGPAMEITLQLDSEADKRELIHFLGANGTLVSAAISCNECPDLEQHFTFVPDAFGRGAFFGFGPLIGQQLVADSSMVLRGLTQEGPLELVVAVEAAPPVDGSPCVFADVQANRQGTAPLLFVSDAGRFLACEGIPFPLLVEAPGWTLKFIAGTWEGHLSASVREPPAPKNMGCGFMEPSSNETVLATSDFVAWAKTEDPYIRDWLSRNPGGVVKPGYGRSRFPDWNTTVNHYMVGAIIPLQDSNGRVEIRLGFEQHSFLNPGRQEFNREYLASEEIQKIGRNAQKSTRLECAGPPIVLETMERQVVSWMPYDEFVNVYVGPDLLAPIQGSHSLLGPFWSGNFSLRDQFLHQPQPDVVFVTTTNSGGMYRPASASLSPNGLIKFIDVDSAEWLASSQQ